MTDTPVVYVRNGVRRLVFLVLCCLCCCAAFPQGVARAADAVPTSGAAEDFSPAPTLLIYFENDLFYRTDRYYTNAVQARFISPDLGALAENQYLPESISRNLDSILFPGSKDAARYNLSLGAGQQIYTPKDTDTSAFQKKDRAYAGYLYGLIGLHAKRHTQLDTLELAAGVIGPSALGKEAQNGIHRARGFETAKGWKHQLKDEPAVMLSWSRVWRLNDALSEGWGWDVLPRVGVSVGTPYTGADLGGEVRFGWNITPDYGSSTIKPGAGITRPDEDGAPASAPLKDRISLYAFAGANGRAVAHNTFLDGGFWRDGHSVDRFPFAGDLTAGLTFALGDFTVTYTHIYRFKEFHNQEKAQVIGSITVGYRF